MYHRARRRATPLSGPRTRFRRERQGV